MMTQEGVRLRCEGQEETEGEVDDNVFTGVEEVQRDQAVIEITPLEFQQVLERLKKRLEHDNYELAKERDRVDHQELLQHLCMEIVIQ